MKEKIIEIIKENRPDLEELEGVNFIEEGLFDSFDIVTMVSDFDKSFGISIDGIDIVPENFETLEAIEKMLVKNGAK